MLTDNLIYNKNNKSSKFEDRGKRFGLRNYY